MVRESSLRAHGHGGPFQTFESKGAQGSDILLACGLVGNVGVCVCVCVCVSVIGHELFYLGRSASERHPHIFIRSPFPQSLIVGSMAKV